MWQLFRQTKSADDDNDGFILMVVRDAKGAFSVGLLDTINPNEQEQERRLQDFWNHGSSFAHVLLFVSSFILSLV